jgi:hypothetical protein
METTGPMALTAFRGLKATLGTPDRKGSKARKGYRVRLAQQVLTERGAQAEHRKK